MGGAPVGTGGATVGHGRDDGGAWAERVMGAAGTMDRQGGHDETILNYL